jgi:hypothetical protein
VGEGIYAWREDKAVLSTSAKSKLKLNAGAHTIVLTVTDPKGAMDTDKVVFTVKRRRR